MKKNDNDAKSWDYYEKTIKSDGRYFDVLINVKDTGNDNYVYDITLKETGSLPSHKGLSDGNSPVYSEDSISQNSEKSSPKYSLTADIRFSLSEPVEETKDLSTRIFGK